MPGASRLIPACRGTSETPHFVVGGKVVGISASAAAFFDTAQVKSLEENVLSIRCSTTYGKGRDIGMGLACSHGK
jgi:hypothetical protein